MVISTTLYYLVITTLDRVAKITGYVALCGRCMRNLSRRKSIVWWDDYCHIIERPTSKPCDGCSGRVAEALAKN
jgi:hypothetical protein